MEKERNYNVSLYFSNCCSISGSECYASDEEAVAKSLEKLNNDDGYYAVTIEKYVGYDKKRGCWKLEPMFAFDKRGEATVYAPLKREEFQEVYKKLKAHRPVYIKLKNGKWNDTIFADTLSYFLRDMIDGDEIEYITNTIKLK